MLSHAENVFLLESFYKTGSVELIQNEFRRRFGKEVDRRTVYRLREKLRDHGANTDRRVIIRIRDAPVVKRCTVRGLKDRIKSAFDDIRGDTGQFLRVSANLLHRCKLVVEKHGEHIEPLSKTQRKI